MLDPEASDEVRDRIVSEARGRIESGGAVKEDNAWGLRKMAYEIRQRTEADYRFFRFQGEAAVLESLDHDLKIADGVLRFRIFKVDARSPVIIPPAPSPSGAPDRPPRRGDDDAAPPPPAEAPQAPAEAAAEPAPEAPEPAPEAPEASEPAPAEPSEPPAAEAPPAEAPEAEPAASDDSPS